MALRTASELLDALDAGAMPAGDRDDGGDDGELGGGIFICRCERVYGVRGGRAFLAPRSDAAAKEEGRATRR